MRLWAIDPHGGGTPVLLPLQGVPNSLAGQRFVGEPANDVQMSVGNVLSTGGLDVPADGIAIRTVQIEHLFGLRQQLVDGHPFDWRKVERRGDVTNGNDHHGASEDRIVILHQIAPCVPDEKYLFEQVVRQAEWTIDHMDGHLLAAWPVRHEYPIRAAGWTSRGR